VLGDPKKISGARSDGTHIALDLMRPSQIMTFDLNGDLERTGQLLGGVAAPLSRDLASDSDNIWSDGAVVDAQVYLGWAYDYFFKRFERHGLDDNDTPIRAIVHPVRRENFAVVSNEELGLFVLNAFWCGVCGSDRRGYMVFGDGLPPEYYVLSGSNAQYPDYQSGALDVVSHELTHGLVSYTSRLINRNESGALNEAFADIIGTSVEFFYQPPGSGPRKADYLMGEDTWGAITPDFLDGNRSLADPEEYGYPDHYSNRYRGTQDNGGVHINATIAGHAFYLAIEGGVNKTSQLAVQGVGASERAQIEKVFYRAFVYFLPPNATFSMARAATIRAAQELYGSGSAAEQAVTQAWTAVGVF
jgi:Zn-dependent metalloprotease